MLCFPMVITMSLVFLLRQCHQSSVVLIDTCCSNCWSPVSHWQQFSSQVDASVSPQLFCRCTVITLYLFSVYLMNFSGTVCLCVSWRDWRDDYVALTAIGIVCIPDIKFPISKVYTKLSFLFQKYCYFRSLFLTVCSRMSKCSQKGLRYDMHGTLRIFLTPKRK